MTLPAHPSLVCRNDAVFHGGVWAVGGDLHLGRGKVLQLSDERLKREVRRKQL